MKAKTNRYLSTGRNVAFQFSTTHFPNARARKQSFLVSKHFSVLNSYFLDSIFQEMLFSAQSITKCTKYAISWFGFHNSVWQKFFDECRSFERLQIFLTTSWILSKCIDWYVVQVNLCQKFFFLQNMGRTCCVQKLFWMSKTISVHNMFSPGLSLEFSFIELVIQWTICRLIVG